MATMMVSNWLESKVLPTTLTLKNIPDELYERLKSAAELNRRSLNSEAIVCLESGLRIVDVPDSANCGCPGFRELWMSRIPRIPSRIPLCGLRSD